MPKVQLRRKPRVRLTQLRRLDENLAPALGFQFAEKKISLARCHYNQRRKLFSARKYLNNGQAARKSSAKRNFKMLFILRGATIASRFKKT